MSREPFDKAQVAACSDAATSAECDADFALEHALEGDFDEAARYIGKAWKAVVAIGECLDTKIGPGAIRLGRIQLEKARAAVKEAERSISELKEEKSDG